MLTTRKYLGHRVFLFDDFIYPKGRVDGGVAGG
jgi:hypothetical protein